MLSDKWTVVTREDGSDLRTINVQPARDKRVGELDPRQQAHRHHRGDESGGQLYLLDTEGREPPRRLAPGWATDNLVFRPPNGRQIAFRALVDGKWGIFVMNADGTDIQPLLEPASPRPWATTPRAWSTRPTGSASSTRATTGLGIGSQRGAASSGS